MARLPWNFKMFDGAHPPYDTKKQMVALKAVPLNPTGKSAYMGHLAHEVGWEVSGSDSHPGGKEGGEGHDLLLEEVTAHNTVETGRKECGKGNQQVHRGLPKQWRPGLSLEETVPQKKKKKK